MIRYALCCDKGHAFDGWFADSAAFDVQAKRGLIACPDCHSLRIAKQIMAPAVTGTRERDSVSVALTNDAPALQSPEERALRAALRRFHEEVVAKTEDVGQRFAEEARKIHYGEADPRAIRGQASFEEARELHEEGVGFLPLPSLPEKGN